MGGSNHLTTEALLPLGEQKVLNALKEDWRRDESQSRSGFDGIQPVHFDDKGLVVASLPVK